MNSFAHSVRGPSWRAFVTGLLQPSGLALGVALTVPALVLGVASVWITPERLAEAPEYFAKDEKDSDVFANAILARWYEAPCEESVYLFGASSILSALTGREPFQELLAEAGQDVSVCDLRTDGQVVGQTLALARALPSKLCGVAVIEVNPRSLAGRVSVPEFRVAYMQEDEFFPGEYFWSNRRFFLPRLIPSIGRVLFDGPVKLWELPWLSYDEPIEPQKGRDLEAWLKQTVNKNYGRQVGRTLGAYAELVRELRARGLGQVVFLEAPAPERTRNVVIGEIWGEHVERMNAFAEQNDVLYWDLCEEAELEESDFWDYTHLFRMPARERFTATLAGRVAALLVEVEG